ncbi:hypothetical protein CI109_104525 [Kwoniella shandongensis]|uniref:Uncharacterized protein n=1 Tax=Kwoniella shandongensis TaxID=1734106 RepID=A0A5M6BTF9_9TREE|nr:uncharacterized protein CI109_005583 [Kwoniella shandongensis]KAA5526148.1 hypothetical protein CI109_005583 [Kwoniella shandongensis]
MTFRSRSGGPSKRSKKGKQTHTRKLHHPPAAIPETPITPPHSPTSLPLPPHTEPFNPPDSELLALLHRSLHSTLSDDNFLINVQRIKGLLRDKRWLEVFCGSEEILESYAGRWVPSRAVCFRELMAGLVGEVFGDESAGLERQLEGLKLNKGDDSEDEDDDEEEQEEDEDNNEDDTEVVQKSETTPQSPAADPSSAESTGESSDQPTHHILSLGGGAGSEFLAISALIRSTLIKRPHSHPKWSWTGIDIGNWHGVLRKIEDAIKVDWKIESDVLDVEYIKGDLMAPVQEVSDSQSTPDASAAGPVDIDRILTAKPPKLITLLFTLTELLSQSRPRTLSLFKSLTQNSPPGTLFLVADSASDISEFTLGAEGRKWPVWMIVDAMLNGKQKGWEKVRGEDSRWFRFEDGVGAGWPCKLENTRYWYRLYKRVE